MSTTVKISFTANTGSVVLDGSKHYGAPAELVVGELRGRDPVAYAAAKEFNANGTTEGTVTVTAA